MPQPLIAITGSTGAVGGMVAARLANQGAELRLIARNAAAAPQIAGVEIATASDYSATREMAAALRGVDTLFLVSGRESENRLEQHYSAIDAADAAGVSRVVYLSILGAAADATFLLARTHFATEQALAQSGMEWVAQRQSIYLEMIPRMVGADGIIRGPAGDGRIAPVSRSDVADVAVTLLSDDSYDGAPINVTGDERLSFRHIANRMTALTGKAVEYVHESEQDAYASRSHLGAPDWEVAGWVTSYLAIAAGEMDVVSEAVLELAGHPPERLDSYLAKHPESWAHIETTASV